MERVRSLLRASWVSLSVNAAPSHCRCSKHQRRARKPIQLGQFKRRSGRTFAEVWAGLWGEPSEARPRGIAATPKGPRPALGQKEQSSLGAMQWRPPPPGKPGRARRALQRKPWAVLPSFPAISYVPPWRTRSPGKDMQGRVCGPPERSPTEQGQEEAQEGALTGIKCRGEAGWSNGDMAEALVGGPRQPRNLRVNVQSHHVISRNTPSYFE